MRKMICVFCLLPLLLVGCGNTDASENMTGYKIDYEVLSEEGIYRVNDQDYPLLIKLTGRSENAKYDCYYIVLTSNADLSFKDVDAKFWGSCLTDSEEFVIVEYGLINK